MATGTAGSAARQYHTQQTHYLRKHVNFNDAGIAAGVVMGTIPAGSVITNTHVVVRTAFNAATTNNLLVGITATGGEIVASADAAAGTTGYKSMVAATVGTNAYQAADTPIYVAYTQTGTAATAGQAEVVVSFVPNNDK